MKPEKPKKFLFIIQGEGRGHLTQAIRLREFILSEGHVVQAVFFGTSPQREVPEYLPDYFRDVFYHRSPNLILSANRRVRLLYTMGYNLFRIHLFLGSVLKIRRFIRQNSPDCVINFYDICGGLASGFSGKKSRRYAISHHFLFESKNFPEIPGFPMQKILLRLHNELVAVRGQKRIALSFRKLPDFKNTRILPPLLRSGLQESKSAEESHVLVYLLNSGLVEEIRGLFRKYRETKFILLTNKTVTPGENTNLEIMQPNYSSFPELLAGSKAVITSGGFETVAEAAFLGKAVYIVPTSNHYEQAGNLADAELSGTGLPVERFELPPGSSGAGKNYLAWCDGLENQLREILFD